MTGRLGLVLVGLLATGCSAAVPGTATPVASLRAAIENAGVPVIAASAAAVVGGLLPSRDAGPTPVGDPA